MSTITKRDLNYIKKRLPKGWTEAIAKTCEKSPSMVKQVMLKERNNPDVVKAAVGLADLSEDKKNEFLQKLD